MNLTGFNPVKVQISIFTTSLTLNKNKVIAKLMESFAHIFDGEMVTLPLPEDAPPQIPHIILDSADTKDLKYRFEIASSRANLFLMSMPQLDISDGLHAGLEIIEKYLSITGATVGRVSVVIDLYDKVENPTQVLIDSFTNKSKFFDDSTSFEFLVHKKKSIGDYGVVNSLVKLKGGILKQPSVSSTPNIVILQHDINTLAEELEKNDFTIEQVKSFIHAAIEDNKALLDQGIS